jgi:flagellar M-ring protein FliF
LPAAAVNSIRFLVANSVEGLQVNNVSVVDNLGNVLSENEESDSLAGLSNNQLTARRNFEQYLTKKAQGMLEQVLGAGQAVVRVSADLNWDTTTRKEVKFDPDSQVATSTTINDENTETANTSGGGPPGATANSSETNSVAVVPVQRSKTTKKVTNSQYEINKMTSEVVQAAGGIKRLSAAVFVAQRFEGKGAERKAVPRTQEEKDKLSNIVRSALGLEEPSDATRKDVVLEEMPFNDQPAVELTQQLDRQEKRQLWFDMAQKAIYPALAIGVLFLFWRLWQKTTKDEIPIAIPATNGNGNGHRKSAQGVVTVEVLNQLIRENPANMTQAVRSWLSRSKPQE